MLGEDECSAVRNASSAYTAGPNLARDVGIQTQLYPELKSEPIHELLTGKRLIRWRWSPTSTPSLYLSPSSFITAVAVAIRPVIASVVVTSSAVIYFVTSCTVNSGKVVTVAVPFSMVLTSVVGAVAVAAVLVSSIVIASSFICFWPARHTVVAIVRPLAASHSQRVAIRSDFISFACTAEVLRRSACVFVAFDRSTGPGGASVVNA